MNHPLRLLGGGLEGEVMCCIYLDILSDVFKSLVDKCTKERRIVA